MSDSTAVAEVQEPTGISFFSIKTGETHYAKLEPTIQAYINSSDMGINASRDQDYGWRLGSDWVKRVRAFRRDQTQMQILAARSNGQKPTITQILYYLYGQDLAAFAEEQEEHENPFEEQYQRDTAGGSPTGAAQPAALADFEGDDDEDITDLIDSEVAASDEEAKPEPAPEAPKAEEKPAKPATHSQKKQ